MGDNNLSIGGQREEVIEANTQWAAEEVLKRKYGKISVIGRASLGNTPTSPSASESASTGCLVFILIICSSLYCLFTGSCKAPSSSSASGPASVEQSSPDATENQSSPSESTVYWGAFAVSPSTSKSSWATGYSSESEAIQAAINSCGESDCRSFSTFGPGYASLAESDKNWYVSSGMSSQGDADRDSMAQCEQRDPDSNCRVTHSVNF